MRLLQTFDWQVGMNALPVGQVATPVCDDEQDLLSCADEMSTGHQLGRNLRKLLCAIRKSELVTMGGTGKPYQQVDEFLSPVLRVVMPRVPRFVAPG